MKTKRWLCALLCVLLCIGLLPTTALAADGDTVYVGGEALTGTASAPVYATTDDSGKVTVQSSYTEQDSWQIKWDGSTLTLRNATIKESVSTDTSTFIAGAAIGVLNQNGDANLTITLEGTNTIAEVGKGIYVLANSTGGATLTITGDGSLNASASQTGIWVQSNSGDATLTIRNAKVEATGTSTAGYGVNVQSHESSTAALTVDGGSLTASGSPGILYDSIGSGTVPNTTALTISNSAIVDARGGGIGAGYIGNLSGVSPTDGSVGIVFGLDLSDSNAGTVYGNVTLQEDLTIGAGESLTLAENASLNANGCSVIVDGGTVDESIKNALGGSVKYPPTIQTESLPGGTVGTDYSQTLAADGSAPIAWSITNGALPEGLTLSNDGEISGTPTAAGTYTFEIGAQNGYGSATGELTIEIKAAPTGAVSVSVTPDAIRLPSVTEGYEPQEPKYITIKNTGDQTIQLKEHGKDPWLIITLDKTTLEPDEEATMKIKLKDGLSADTPSTLKAFITYTGKDGTEGIAHFEVSYEVKHDMERVDAKEPTHLEDGNIECWYCAYCQKYYKGAAGANELSLEEIIIPKLKDHTADGTGWHSDETNHWNTCACGEKLNTAAHTFAWITDKEATATENGSKHEACTVCGYAKAAVEIPATGTATPAPTTTPAPTATAAPTATTAPTATAAPTATPAPTAEPGLGPQTGDPGVSALWFAAPAVSGLGLAAACRRRRRGTK